MKLAIKEWSGRRNLFVGSGLASEEFEKDGEEKTFLLNYLRL